MIVQGYRTVLLEVDNPQYAEARDALARFAELEKSPEYVHTYRVSSLSLWNAAAAGLGAKAILGDLERFSKYPLPDNLRIDITESIGRYGRIRIVVVDGRMLVVSEDRTLVEELSRHKLFAPLILARLDVNTFEINPTPRRQVKRALIPIGYPAEDLAGYVDGQPLDVQLRHLTAQGLPFDLRAYQTDAADVYWAGGSAAGGSGVIVLPCGAGKTMVGLAAMARTPVSYTHLRAHETVLDLVCRLLLEKKNTHKHS